MSNHYCVYDSGNLANNEMVCFGSFDVGCQEIGCTENTIEYIKHNLNPSLEDAGLVPLKIYKLGIMESAVPNGYYKKLDASYLHIYIYWLINNKEKNGEKPPFELFKRTLLKGE